MIETRRLNLCKVTKVHGTLYGDFYAYIEKLNVSDRIKTYRKRDIPNSYMYGFNIIAHIILLVEFGLTENKLNPL